MTRRASPPLPLAAAPDAESDQKRGRRTQDPHSWPPEPREFGLLQLLALWGTGFVFDCLPFSSRCLEPKAPAHPPPPGSGPERT